MLGSEAVNPAIRFLQALYRIYPEYSHLRAKVKVFIAVILNQSGGELPPWDRGAGLRTL